MASASVAGQPRSSAWTGLAAVLVLLAVTAAVSLWQHAPSRDVSQNSYQNQLAQQWAAALFSESGRAALLRSRRRAGGRRRSRSRQRRREADGDDDVDEPAYSDTEARTKPSTAHSKTASGAAQEMPIQETAQRDSAVVAASASPSATAASSIAASPVIVVPPAHDQSPASIEVTRASPSVGSAHFEVGAAGDEADIAAHAASLADVPGVGVLPAPGPAAGTASAAAADAGLFCAAQPDGAAAEDPAAAGPVLYWQRFRPSSLPLPKCERFFGNTWIRHQLQSRTEICSPLPPAGSAAPQPIPSSNAAGSKRVRSRISRWDAATGTRLYWMRNVAIDFSTARVGGDVRSLGQGFITAACAPPDASSVRRSGPLDFDGDAHESTYDSVLALQSPGDSLPCDEWEMTPTVIMRHDDIGNLYHSMVDLWRVWLTLALLQQPACLPAEQVGLAKDSSGKWTAIHSNRSTATRDGSGSSTGGVDQTACLAGTAEQTFATPAAVADTRDPWGTWPGNPVVDGTVAASLAPAGDAPAPQAGPDGRAAAPVALPPSPAEALIASIAATGRRKGLSPGQLPSLPTCAEDEVLTHGLDPRHAQLLNFDERVMCNVVTLLGERLSQPEEDCPGPFFSMYEKWFGKGIRRGRDYGTRRVCFAAVAVAARTPESQVWSYFAEKSLCDMPSPIFQQFIAHTMHAYDLTSVVPDALHPHAVTCPAKVLAKATGGKAAVATAAAAAAAAPLAGNASEPLLGRHPAPHLLPSGSADANGTDTKAARSACRPYIRVLYVARKRKPFHYEPVKARTLGNEGPFLTALAAAGEAAGVTLEVDTADFTGMPFDAQLRRVRAAHIMIGASFSLQQPRKHSYYSIC